MDLRIYQRLLIPHSAQLCAIKSAHISPEQGMNTTSLNQYSCAKTQQGGIPHQQANNLKVISSTLPKYVPAVTTWTVAFALCLCGGHSVYRSLVYVTKKLKQTKYLQCFHSSEVSPKTCLIAFPQGKVQETSSWLSRELSPGTENAQGKDNALQCTIPSTAGFCSKSAHGEAEHIWGSSLPLGRPQQPLS